MPRATKEDLVLETSLALFATHGYHAVGVDRIKEASGVAKMTLYKHFPTKDILIEKVLVRRDEHMRAGLLAAIAEPKVQAQGPLAQLRAVFGWHRQWFASPAFHGCMFIKASEEFLDDASGIRGVSRVHKLWLRDLMDGLLQQAGAAQHAALAAHLLIVLDGLIVDANLFRGQDQVDSTWVMVQDLLAQHLPAQTVAAKAARACARRPAAKRAAGRR